MFNTCWWGISLLQTPHSGEQFLSFVTNASFLLKHVIYVPPRIHQESVSGSRATKVSGGPVFILLQNSSAIGYIKYRIVLVVGWPARALFILTESGRLSPCFDTFHRRTIAMAKVMG